MDVVNGCLNNDDNLYFDKLSIVYFPSFGKISFIYYFSIIYCSVINFK